jgi:hypothetical protein
VNDHIILSGTWVYGTGNSITLPMSQYIISPHNITGADPYNSYNFYNSQRISAFDQVINDYGEKNNFRMRAYHRLDAGIQFHKKKNGENVSGKFLYTTYITVKILSIIIRNKKPMRIRERYLDFLSR